MGTHDWSWLPLFLRLRGKKGAGGWGKLRMLEPLPRAALRVFPVLDPADHLFDSEAERGELDRGFGRAIAAWSPAVDDKQLVFREFGRRFRADFALQDIDRMNSVAAHVDQDEIIDAVFHVGVYVRRISLVAQFAQEEGVGIFCRSGKCLQHERFDGRL